MPLLRDRPITRYKDFKVDLDVHPQTGELSIDKDANAVQRSIKNLMFTDTYERPFQPKLGSGLKAYLFENVSRFTADQIRQRIIYVIETYEPRAQLLEVVVKAEPDYNRYQAKIAFNMINRADPIIFTAILTRVR